MSATYQEGNHITFPSATDFTSGGTVLVPGYQIVKLNSSGQVVAAAAATDPVLGVLHNVPPLGGAADVLSRNASGTGKVVAGGNVAVNDLVTSDASGKAVKTTTSGDQVLGRALEAGVSGQVIVYQPLDATV